MRPTQISTPILSLISSLVIGLTILAVWLFGLGNHSTLYINSILSTTILSITFFLFITVGLYNGVKLSPIKSIAPSNGIRQSPIKPIAPYKRKKESSFEGDDSWLSSFFEGEADNIFSFLLFGIGIIIAVILFGLTLFSSIPIFMGMISWIFYNAYSIVFDNSYYCKGRLIRSTLYALYYTFFYNCWIYGIILGIHYWR